MKEAAAGWRFMDFSKAYSELGVDAEGAIRTALGVPISVHCWQADDVQGFEVFEQAVQGGGILATGNYPGRARNLAEVRADLDQVLKLSPGPLRLNLHATYADTGGKPVARDQVGPEHFDSWIAWANHHSIGLDFNPTYFAHPLADSGFTLSSADPKVSAFWVRHGIASRHIAAHIAKGTDKGCTNNHWIPDGAKDHPVDRWGYRKRLADALDEVFAIPVAGSDDAVESKLFGLGSEDFVVGSFEFYSHYALTRKKLLCLDMGHFHPTESVADKLSALLLYHPELLLHVSRPMRWDSDHVVIFNDDLKALFEETVRGNALSKIRVALDFFDASINRLIAYTVGIRATRKAILWALLQPTAKLQELEAHGKLGEKLALLEELHTLPFGAAWDALCEEAGVPVGTSWIDQASEYGCKIQAERS
jgi:L-rhamnose isomerase